MERTQIIILGNIVSFAGALVMVSIGFIKGKKRMLVAQCIQFLVMGMGNLILGGFTGFLSNIVSMLRNLWSFKFKYTWPVKVIVIAIQLILSVKINTLGIIGWLPVIAACAFTWFLDVKSDFGLKLLIVTTQIPWLIYDIYILNISGSVFDILTMITTTTGLIMIYRDNKAKQD